MEVWVVLLILGVFVVFEAVCIGAIVLALIDAEERILDLEKGSRGE